MQERLAMSHQTRLDPGQDQDQAADQAGDLLGRARAGDRDALNELCQENWLPIYRSVARWASTGTISCSDRQHCWAAMSSQIGEPTIATAFAATSDGGATWVTQSLPVQRARQFIPLGMSCPTALRCYAAGGDSAGPVILTTRNGGTTWSPVNLPKANSGNPQDSGIEPYIGLIACSAASRCVAAPESSPSARWIPIYSLGSS
jgi:hypothetical protein